MPSPGRPPVRIRFTTSLPPATTSRATSYYCARDLQKSVRVPMGLIHASWGGSRIEPWMSEAALRAMGGFDIGLDLLKIYAADARSGNERMGALWKHWWRSHAPAGAQAGKA